MQVEFDFYQNMRKCDELHHLGLNPSVLISWCLNYFSSLCMILFEIFISTSSSKSMNITKLKIEPSSHQLTGVKRS